MRRVASTAIRRCFDVICPLDNRLTGKGPRVVFLIFSYIRRLGHFLGLKFLNFNISGDFKKKMNIFLGMKILWIFFWVITKLDYILG